MSQFVKDIQNAKVEPIQPRFVDFKNDLTISETKRKLPLLYVKNNSTDSSTSRSATSSDRKTTTATAWLPNISTIWAPRR